MPLVFVSNYLKNVEIKFSWARLCAIFCWIKCSPLFIVTSHAKKEEKILNQIQHVIIIVLVHGRVHTSQLSPTT